MDNFRHAVLTSTYTNELDTNGTLTAQSLSKAHREPLRGVARGVLVAIGISLLLVPSAGSSEPVLKKTYISYKEYASIILDNQKQYICLSQLYGKESAWNPEAVNGSHYGIPQGNSIYLSTLNGYEQIQWGLDYINNRYDGDTCKAWEHWKAYGWH